MLLESILAQNMALHPWPGGLCMLFDYRVDLTEGDTSMTLRGRLDKEIPWTCGAKPIERYDPWPCRLAWHSEMYPWLNVVALPWQGWVKWEWVTLKTIGLCWAGGQIADQLTERCHSETARRKTWTCAISHGYCWWKSQSCVDFSDFIRHYHMLVLLTLSCIRYMQVFLQSDHVLLTLPLLCSSR